MTAPGYGVSPDAVKGHGDRLQNAIMDRIRLVVDAADQVKFGDDEVYGKILVHVIPPIVTKCTGDAVEALRKLADLGDEVTNNVKAVAETYREADDAVRALMEKIITR